MQRTNDRRVTLAGPAKDFGRLREFPVDVSGSAICPGAVQGDQKIQLAHFIPPFIPISKDAQVCG